MGIYCPISASSFQEKYGAPEWSVGFSRNGTPASAGIGNQRASARAAGRMPRLLKKYVGATLVAGGHLCRLKAGAHFEGNRDAAH
jgi:hypothetical protein